jgi:hypothetical protein
MLAIGMNFVSSDGVAPPTPLKLDAVAGPDKDRALQSPNAATIERFIRTLHVMLSDRCDHSFSRVERGTSYLKAQEGSETTYAHGQPRAPTAEPTRVVLAPRDLIVCPIPLNLGST